jgi:hypothetical protein
MPFSASLKLTDFGPIVSGSKLASLIQYNAKHDEILAVKALKFRSEKKQSKITTSGYTSVEHPSHIFFNSKFFLRLLVLKTFDCIQHASRAT